MVIILQIVYSLYDYMQRALKQGKKDEHSKHNDILNFLQKQTCFLSYALLSLCVPYNSSLFLSFPARQKLLDVGKKNMP